jgi:hypothetical protein
MKKKYKNYREDNRTQDHDYYKNLLLARKAKGTATSSELNFIKNNFKEPKQFKVKKSYDKPLWQKQVRGKREPDIYYGPLGT